jgi:hypothetical protein
MDWKKLACCVALGGALTACGGGTTPPDAPPQTRRYVLSAIRIPEPMGTTAVGFNLDGMNSDGTGTTCVELSPDYTSINDAPETGVDNALGSLVPQLGMLLGDSCPMGTPAADCLSALIGQQITEGKLLIVMEVRDINSFVTDSSIEVQLYLGTVPGGGAPMLAGSTLAPDQAFENPKQMGRAVVQHAPTRGKIRRPPPRANRSKAMRQAHLDLLQHPDDALSKEFPDPRD